MDNKVISITTAIEKRIAKEKNQKLAIETSKQGVDDPRWLVIYRSIQALEKLKERIQND